MHAKSGRRVVLEWKIYRLDSVIADVIKKKRHSFANLAMLRASDGMDSLTSSWAAFELLN